MQGLDHPCDLNAGSQLAGATIVEISISSAFTAISEGDRRSPIG